MKTQILVVPVIEMSTEHGPITSNRIEDFANLVRSCVRVYLDGLADHAERANIFLHAAKGDAPASPQARAMPTPEIGAFPEVGELAFVQAKRNGEWTLFAYHVGTNVIAGYVDAKNAEPYLRWLSKVRE